MRYAVITIDGDVEVNDSDSSQLDIEAISALVAGEKETDATFSAVFGEDVSVYFNDNGKLIGLDVNIIATQFAHRRQLIAPEDFIVGNVVIFGGVDDEGYDKPVTEELLEELH